MTNEIIIKPEAIKESIEYFTRDSYRQQEANNDLALILEIIRAEVDKKISPYLAYQKIKGVFPE